MARFAVIAAAQPAAPGMNPYLEQAELWQDFHLEFLPAMRRQLVPQVGPDYIIKLEEHLYIHDLPPEPRIGRSDLSVARPEIGQSEKAGIFTGVLEAPARVETPEQDVERVPFLEIRDRVGRELITVVELLSPSNKRPGDDHEQYLTNRRELLRSRAHLVEVDLLRGGAAMPVKNRPDCDYSILISRVQDRPYADFWPIGLRDRLPLIPIPLRLLMATSGSIFKNCCTESTRARAMSTTSATAHPILRLLRGSRNGPESTSLRECDQNIIDSRGLTS